MVGCGCALSASLAQQTTAFKSPPTATLTDSDMQSTVITNALTIDVEDYFQVSAMAPYIRRSEWDSRECRRRAGFRPRHHGWPAGRGKRGRVPELWDGHAAERIAADLWQWLGDGAP